MESIMKSYVQSFITGGVFIFSFFVFIGQSDIKLSDEDKKWYRSKGWVIALFDLENNLSDRIDSLSRLLALEVNDIESDIKSLDDRLKILEVK